jgi:phosphoglycolate phosphatase-like HAD superfamily hydrolase
VTDAFSNSEARSSIAGLIFDVEGTLVDCVDQTLESWRETLADFGLNFSIEQLHPYSGMDGSEMLDVLLQDSKARNLKREILREQGARYREKFLPTVAAFPGIRSLFEYVKEVGWRVGLATTCQPDELKRYGSIVGAFDLVDAVACGADVKRGKPDSGLHVVALERLGIVPGQALSVGDTPYDAVAAARAGLTGAIGVLTGGFSSIALRAAGCRVVVEQASDLLTTIKDGDWRLPAHQP